MKKIPDYNDTWRALWCLSLVDRWGSRHVDSRKKSWWSIDVFELRLHRIHLNPKAGFGEVSEGPGGCLTYLFQAGTSQNRNRESWLILNRIKSFSNEEKIRHDLKCITFICLKDLDNGSQEWSVYILNVRDSGFKDLQLTQWKVKSCDFGLQELIKHLVQYVISILTFFSESQSTLNEPCLEAQTFPLTDNYEFLCSKHSSEVQRLSCCCLLLLDMSGGKEKQLTDTSLPLKQHWKDGGSERRRRRRAAGLRGWWWLKLGRCLLLSPSTHHPNQPWWPKTLRSRDQGGLRCWTIISALQPWGKVSNGWLVLFLPLT